MRYIVPVLLFSTLLMAQPGWRTIKDKTGSCQLSVPPNWIVSSTPGHVSSPDHMDTTVITGLRAYRPFSEETLKMLNIATVFENSAKRLFYVTKPAGNAVTYHVEVPGGAKSCVAQISARPSYSQDEAKKIALTLSAAK